MYGNMGEAVVGAIVVLIFIALITGVVAGWLFF